MQSKQITDHLLGHVLVFAGWTCVRTDVRIYVRRHVHVVQFVCIYHIGSKLPRTQGHSIRTRALLPSFWEAAREYAIERDTTIDDACAPTVRHRPIDDDPIRRRRLCCHASTRWCRMQNRTTIRRPAWTGLVERTTTINNTAGTPGRRLRFTNQVAASPRSTYLPIESARKNKAR